MTCLIFDKTPDDLEVYWTTERLKEEFFLSLASATDKIYNEKGMAVTVRKYYAQARFKMNLIPVAKATPPFVIYWSDLTPRVQEDFTKYLKDIDKKKLSIFLKEVAGRFFENLDFAYYHGSVMKCLCVRIEQ